MALEVEAPTVIGAAEAIGFNPTILEAGTAMGTAIKGSMRLAAAIAVEDVLITQQGDLTRRRSESRRMLNGIPEIVERLVHGPQTS
jgi:hypothetical protein